MNSRRFLLQRGMLLIIVACVTACTQAVPPSSTSITPTTDSAHLTAFAQPQPTSPPLPTPTPNLIDPPVGPVPPDCPTGPTPQPIFGGLGPVIGNAPVWASGFDGPHATILYPMVTYFLHGWQRKVIWEVGPRFSHQVTIHAMNTRTVAQLWFQIDDQDPIMTSLVLDPQHPNHPASVGGVDYREWGSYLYIPAAGCYQLEATWPGGQWHIMFTFGRQ